MHDWLAHLCACALELEVFEPSIQYQVDVAFQANFGIELLAILSPAWPSYGWHEQLSSSAIGHKLKGGSSKR